MCGRVQGEVQLLVAGTMVYMQNYGMGNKGNSYWASV